MSLIRASRCLPPLWMIEPLHPLGLVGVGFSPQQVGKTDDAVERRADFVAHVGQERGPGLAGAFGPQRRFLERGRPLADLAFQLLGRLPQRLSARLLSVMSKAIPCRNSGRPCSSRTTRASPCTHTSRLSREINRYSDLKFTPAARPGELGPPALAVFRVQLAVPEERISQPFRLREAEHLFDLRADVEFVVPLVEGRHEGHGGIPSTSVR